MQEVRWRAGEGGRKRRRMIQKQINQISNRIYVGKEARSKNKSKERMYLNDKEMDEYKEVGMRRQGN